MTYNNILLPSPNSVGLTEFACDRIIYLYLPIYTSRGAAVVAVMAIGLFAMFALRVYV